MKANRYFAAAATGAVALLIGGGAAFAGQSAADKGARCEARLAKIAEKQGLTVAEVEARVKGRLTARVDAALQSGRINAERAALLKERIAEGSICKGHALRAKLGRHSAARGGRAVPRARPRGAQGRASGNVARSAGREAGQERGGTEGRDARSRRGQAGEGRRAEPHLAGACRPLARPDRATNRSHRREDVSGEVALRTFLGNSQERLTKPRLGGKGIPSDCTSEGPQLRAFGVQPRPRDGSASSLTSVPPVMFTRRRGPAEA